MEIEGRYIKDQFYWYRFMLGKNPSNYIFKVTDVEVGIGFAYTIVKDFLGNRVGEHGYSVYAQMDFRHHAEHFKGKMTEVVYGD